MKMKSTGCSVRFIEFPRGIKQTNSDIWKLIPGCEAWGDKTKDIILRFSNE